VDKRKWLQLFVYAVSLVSSLALDLAAPNVKSLLCSPIDLEKVNKVVSPSAPETVAMVGIGQTFDNLDKLYGWGDYPQTGVSEYA
jgi:hypothetical protein